MKLPIIGSLEFMSINGEDAKIPVKIDTGADTSSIWASDFHVNSDGELSFKFFAPGSDLYTGKTHKTKDFYAAQVKSSNGHSQIRYRINLEITLAGQTFTTPFTLSDRSRNYFPVLIGRYALDNRFLVDVSKTAFPRPDQEVKSRALTSELQQNPHAFHNKYFK